MNLELILIGLMVGTIVGLTGVGGAAIMTPLLVLGAQSKSTGGRGKRLAL